MQGAGETQTSSLDLNNIPASEVLRHIGDLASIQFEYDKYAIKVHPAGPTAAAPVQAPVTKQSRFSRGPT